MVVEETDVFAIHIDIEKATEFAGFITQATFNTGITPFKGIKQSINAAGSQLSGRLVVGELLQGGRNQYLDSHGV